MRDRNSSLELRSLMQALYQAWMRGGTEMLEFFSQGADVLLIGTDQDEWVEGGRLARAAFARQLGEMGAVRIRPGTLHTVDCGNAGWIVDDPHFCFAQGENVQLRITAIAVRERFNWKFVHWHVSIGSPNPEALGLELTTSLDEISAAVKEEQPDLGADIAQDGTVMILFTDIVDSTRLNEVLGDHQWLDLLSQHDRIVETESALRCGRVIKHQGDGFMLVFPAAAQALEAALAIQHELLNDDGLLRDLQVRMGLHGGRPIERRGDFFGRDVAYAARVAAAAEGREILVSSFFRQALPSKARQRLSAPRPQHFKGIHGPQQTYLVQT